jgi:hypothetical protein
LKYFRIDVSDSLISIKYRHPTILSIRDPVLELPVQMVSYCKIEKGILSSFLVLKIDTKRGFKKFYYKLGFLDEAQLDRIKNILNCLADYNETDNADL